MDPLDAGLLSLRIFGIIFKPTIKSLDDTSQPITNNLAKVLDLITDARPPQPLSKTSIAVHCCRTAYSTQEYH